MVVTVEVEKHPLVSWTLKLNSVEPEVPDGVYPISVEAPLLSDPVVVTGLKVPVPVLVQV